MNLLGKVKSIGALVMSFLLLNSCEENGSFGFGTDDLVPVQFSVETVAVESSVVLLDSITSSNLAIGLIGNLDDPDFGRLKASSYAKLSLQIGSLPSISEEAILDSVKLNIRFGYIYKENAKIVKLEVLKLAEEFRDTLRVTTNSTLISNELIASGDIFVDDFDSVYSIHADVDFGAELFEKIITEDSDVSSQDNFEAFFPGVAFQASGTNDNVFGVRIDRETNITLYYREPTTSGGPANNPLTHTMIFGSLAHYYGLEVDRSSSSLSQVQEPRVEYSPTSGLRYLQSGVGVVTKLDFSALESFANNNPNIIVNTAQVSIGPIQDLPNGVSPPSSLLLLLTDSDNVIIQDGSAFRAIQQDGANPIGSNTPLRLIYNAETRTYTSAITSFISNYFSDVFRRDQFFIFPQVINNSLSQIVFAPEDFKLKIFYSELK